MLRELLESKTFYIPESDLGFVDAGRAERRGPLDFELELFRVELPGDKYLELDEMLDSYKWLLLINGGMGRRAPGVGADMAVDLFVTNGSLHLGFYSVFTRWESVAGPSFIQIKKLQNSVVLNNSRYHVEYCTDHESNFRADPMEIYRSIHRAASSSKMVKVCPNCGLLGPGWEVRNDCGSCSLRIY